MVLIPVENVALVGNTVATGKFARRLEGLDEFVLISGGSASVAGLADLTGSGTTLGKQSRVSGIKVQQHLGNVLALAFVGAQDRAVRQSGFHGVELPGHVQSVMESSVHTLTGFGLQKC